MIEPNGNSRRLVFRTSQEYFAVPLESVLEVIGRTSVCEPTSANPFVQVRSQAIPCLPTPWPVTGSTSVVYGTSKGIGALVVDAVCGIFRAHDCKFHPAPLSLGKAELMRLVHVLEIEALGVRACELNFEVIIDQLKPEFEGLKELALQTRTEQVSNIKSSQMVIEIQLESDSVALQVMDVERIIPYREPSPIAGLPDFALGLINVEGSIIPLLDLQRRLKIPNGKPGTRIVVVTAQGSKWGLSVPKISNLTNLSGSREADLSHELGDYFSRPGQASLLLLQPDKLVQF
jgi:chemotaxis signal transduction protein